MDLDLSEEQQMLAETVRGVCQQSCGLDVVRRLEDDPVGYSTEFWKQLAALDLVGLTLPEDAGGSGQSLLEAAVVYEELGRALAPSPHFVSAVMAAGCIVRAGTPAQQQDWLPRVATGDAVLTPAWLEPDRGFGAVGVALRAEADGDAFVLSGTKWHVPFAAAADALVVLARTGDADDAVDLFLVDRAAPGVTIAQQLTTASDAEYAVRLDGVRVDATARIGGAGTGWATWDAQLLDGLVLLGAQAVGGAEAALEVTVQYAKDRQQFDKPLGAFQSIAHYLSDAATAVDGARTLVYEAAWAGANGRSLERLAPMAKLFVCSTFRDVTATCQQIWGGLGFTLEADVQLYFRRAKVLQLTWLDDRALEGRIAAAILD